MEQNGTLKKQKKHLFLQKNQLTMNNFRKKWYICSAVLNKQQTY